MGRTIGIRMDAGYPGALTRSVDVIVSPFPVDAGTTPILWGQAVALTATGSVTNATDTNDIIGIAVRRVQQPSGNNPQVWDMQAGDVCDVLVRGAVIVEVDPGTLPAPGSPVFFDDTTQLFTAVDTDTPIPNAVYTNGVVDPNNCTEILITTRSI